MSCILSQHTSDRTSYPAFTALRRKYPEWGLVLAAGPEQIAEDIRGAGLANQKSKSICGCLREVEARTGGFSLDLLKHMSLQEALAWLTSLPGVGPKTASLVLCFSFDKGAIPVDTHVFRVSKRLGLIPDDMAETAAHEQMLRIVTPNLAGRFHLGLLAHGRAVCKAPRPDCARCTLNDVCQWFNEIPNVTKPKAKPKRRTA